MKSNKIVISGIGCALIDHIYNNISFEDDSFKNFLSVKTGDGGLVPGKLVFKEELETFASEPYQEILDQIIEGCSSMEFNLGGPSLVALIHAVQILDPNEFDINFYGITGKDEAASQIMSLIKKTPLDISNYKMEGTLNTPFTDVFSDPLYDHGHGERTFVNSIGAAGELSPAHIPDEFFTADVVCFGGTALVPQIHDDLSNLLRRGKKNGNITLVNTVFDFRNEKRNPDRPWPLVDHVSDFKLIDVLILDCEEALRISGTKEMDEAALFFKDAGVSAFLITNGSKYIIGYSDGGLFHKQDIAKFPVSERVVKELKNNPHLKGDTTGCGDNFAGGFIASLAQQLKSEKKKPLSFIEAISWAVASGGFACFHVGGTYYEASGGEKLAKIKDYQQGYINQTGNTLQ